ncbi:auxin-responsive protein SAUR32-like [Salvia hispanica]|uniref:auxin-responsive protein SAUR32-like n=1 Tax=Salvia hispanica TaxID=49212 RepID=UPI002009B89D|nr:auxin-responsive protein SAUR32-like [Salvia hispanica]
MGSSGDLKSGGGHHLSFHLQHGGAGRRGIPRGCVAITVGQGAEQQRFVIPVMYVNHPLFTELLREAEEEYGFDQKGAINIPCHVEEFRQVRGLIDQDATSNHHVHHHHHHHAHHHQFLCFRA